MEEYIGTVKGLARPYEMLYYRHTEVMGICQKFKIPGMRHAIFFITCNRSNVY